MAPRYEASDAETERVLTRDLTHAHVMTLSMLKEYTESTSR